MIETSKTSEWQPAQTTGDRAPILRRRTGTGPRVAVGTAVTLVALSLSAIAAQAETVHCGHVITADTTLTNDVTGCTGDGIIIGADGVTLDLNGHLVSGASMNTGAGINFAGHSNVQVLNGEINAFYYGVYIDGNHNQVTGVESSGAVFGFYIEGGGAGGNDNTLRNVRVTGDSTSVGIIVRGGERNTVTHSVAEGARSANISFANGTDNTIIKTKAIDGQADGIYLHSEMGATVIDSTVTGNGYNGITLFFTQGATLSGNNVTDNASLGLYLVVPRDSQITDNKVRRNGKGGLWDVCGQGNTLSGNTFTFNGGSGIYIDPCGTAILTGNTASRNARDGITDNSSGSVLTSNRADFNQGHGIVTKGVDGGGNQAFGNVTPPQCIGVDCSTKGGRQAS